MSYRAIRTVTRGLLREVEGEYKDRILVDEHPWGAEDMFTVSVLKEGQVAAALILRAVLFSAEEAAGLDIESINMSSLARRILRRFGAATTQGAFVGIQESEVSRFLFERLGSHLGPTATERARQREASDLVARTRATRPRVIPQVIPAESGFDLVLHGLTANDVLRAVEALPEAKPPSSSRTAYEHLLADEL